MGNNTECAGLEAELEVMKIQCACKWASDMQSLGFITGTVAQTSKQLPYLTNAF